MHSLGIIRAVLKLKDQMTPALKRAGKSIDRAAKAAKRALLPMTIGLGLAGLAAVKVAADFDSAFNKSIAIMGNLGASTEQEFNQISDTMKRVAREVAKSSTFGASQAAEAYFFLASAGLDAQASIKALPLVTRFAQAGMFDLALATDLLTDAQSALGLTVDDTEQNMTNMANVSDVLVKANTLANASVQQFSESLTNKAGAALKILGKDIEEGVAVLAAFADQGLKGSEAGTAFGIVLRDLSTKAIKNAEDFKALGVSVFDQSGEMRNIGDIIINLETALAGMSDETTKATLLNLGFADKSVAFTQSLLGMGTQIKAYEVELRKAGGTTQEVSDKQLKSFTSQMIILKNKIKDVGISLGNELIPIVQSLNERHFTPMLANIEEGVKWFGELEPKTQDTAIGITAIAAASPLAVIGLGAVTRNAKELGGVLTLLGGAKAGIVGVFIAG